MALEHGGQLTKMAKLYGIDAHHWLDLSTGIAPYSYPIPAISPQYWQQLPQHSESLINAARNYYQAQHLLVCNGSQAIIKILPRLWKIKNPCAKHVYLPRKGYKEHQLAWENARFTLEYYDDELPPVDRLSADSVLVIINPNNPTGQLFSQQHISTYQQAMAQLNGLLVLDEAFMDVISPSQSIISELKHHNTLVLRSFGKFFGLAGIRIGFLVANKDWVETVNAELGPWQVNGPAVCIAQHALEDIAWQSSQRSQLNHSSAQLRRLLAEHFPADTVLTIEGTALFQTVTFRLINKAPDIAIGLCKRAIYPRLTDDKMALRFGIALPEDLERLRQALVAVTA